jgi:hypothetical protein
MQERNIVTTEICTNIMTRTLFFPLRYFTAGFWQSMTDSTREEYIIGFFLSTFLLHGGILLTFDR